MLEDARVGTGAIRLRNAPCFAEDLRRSEPAILEEISLETIPDRGFRFKEQGFYIVNLKRCDSNSGQLIG